MQRGHISINRAKLTVFLDFPPETEYDQARRVQSALGYGQVMMTHQAIKYTYTSSQLNSDW